MSHTSAAPPHQALKRDLIEPTKEIDKSTATFRGCVKCNFCQFSYLDASCGKRGDGKNAMRWSVFLVNVTVFTPGAREYSHGTLGNLQDCRQKILKNNIWTCCVCGELWCAPFYAVVTVTFLAGTDPLRPGSVWEQVAKIPSAALSSPRCFHAVPSLHPFLFLLITRALIYDRTRGNSFQVLIRISPMLSPCCACSFTPLMISLSPYLYSGLCFGALFLYQNRSTPWFQSLCSLLNTQLKTPGKYTPQPPWLKGIYASAIPEFSLSRLYREEKVNPILSVLKGALTGQNR